MHPQPTARLALPAAIVIAAVILSGTLLALNVRVSYPTQGMNSQTYLRLTTSGCTENTSSLLNGAAIALSCPAWVRP
jgi:hypothetical protein